MAGPASGREHIGAIADAAERDDDYVSVIPKKMKKRDTAKPRSRILADDEIRAIWKQAEGNGRFGAIVRLALLTGQRRTVVAAMKWDDLAGFWAAIMSRATCGNVIAPALPCGRFRSRPARRETSS
jgi:integrase